MTLNKMTLIIMAFVVKGHTAITTQHIAVLSVAFLIVMLGAFMLTVIVLSVVAPIILVIIPTMEKCPFIKSCYKYYYKITKNVLCNFLINSPW
jgi:hypothetical protein